LAALMALQGLPAPPVQAASHREAPLIANDPPADITDFYAFRNWVDPNKVVFILNVIPAEEPSSGPNYFNFSDDVLYTIHLDTNGDGNADDINYEFRFTTQIRPPFDDLPVSYAGLVAAGLIPSSETPHRPTTPSSSLPAATPASFPAGDTLADRAIHAAEAEIARVPQHGQGYVSLATAYMRKARESGDGGYYLRAETAVQHALQLQPGSVAGLRTLAWVQTDKHEFREALATAERLHSQLPNDSLVYGLVGDAAVELGDYDRATEAFQKMLDLRPGQASYSRAAYLRELHGDLPGAAELMTLAVRSGNTSDPEPLAWCLVQLGNMDFNQGRLNEAEAVYQSARAVFPQYYQALVALGRVRGAQQRYAEAITLYQQAAAIIPAPDMIAALGDLLALVGKADDAEKQYALVEYIEHVNETNQVAYNRQLALFYADHDRKLDEAITLAEAELDRRHDIYTYDTLAWVYYKNGRYADAWKAMEQALHLGTRDALLFFHAGMIAYGLGKRGQARDYLHQALMLNPHFHLIQSEVAKRMLTELESGPSAAAALE
jgi:tetratricopeptide (TPR) repeat protein